MPSVPLCNKSFKPIIIRSGNEIKETIFKYLLIWQLEHNSYKKNVFHQNLVNIYIEKNWRLNVEERVMLEGTVNAF